MFVAVRSKSNDLCALLRRLSLLSSGEDPNPTIPTTRRVRADTYYTTYSFSILTLFIWYFFKIILSFFELSSFPLLTRTNPISIHVLSFKRKYTISNVFLIQPLHMRRLLSNCNSMPIAKQVFTTAIYAEIQRNKPSHQLVSSAIIFESLLLNTCAEMKPRSNKLNFTVVEVIKMILWLLNQNQNPRDWLWTTWHW